MVNFAIFVVLGIILITAIVISPAALVVKIIVSLFISAGAFSVWRAEVRGLA